MGQEYYANIAKVQIPPGYKGMVILSTKAHMLTTLTEHHTTLNTQTN